MGGELGDDMRADKTATDDEYSTALPIPSHAAFQGGRVWHELSIAIEYAGWTGRRGSIGCPGSERQCLADALIEAGRQQCGTGLSEHLNVTHRQATADDAATGANLPGGIGRFAVELR